MSPDTRVRRGEAYGGGAGRSGKKPDCSKQTVKTFAIALVACLVMPSCGDSRTADPPLESYVERGEYAVGMRALYFHDPTRQFDSWNAAHASDGYKAVLREINDAGETQIVAAHVWYPVDDPGSARQATLDDFANSISQTFRNQYEFGSMFFLANLVDAEGQAIFSNPAAMPSILAEARNRLVDAYYQAPIAEGRFPVIIAAHGLGGTSFGWAAFAEYLASHGYVVVAPSFISDSSLPNVLDSPDSRYARASDAAAVDRAYQTILGESKVIPGFYKYFFGEEQPGFGGPGGSGEPGGFGEPGGPGEPGGSGEPPDQAEQPGFEGPEGMRALPGGARKVGEMMGEFFTQRVADVETVIDGLSSLNESLDSCSSEYTAQGQPVHGAEVCGFFSDALDVENIGVMGHSLGSMTAQFTVASNEKVTAAVGYNNGPPRYWEPAGIFGGGAAEDGQPAGSSRPVMQIHGSEDAFVQGVFRGLMWNTYIAAGGNPEDIWLLEQERVPPTDENPQPIARNAYNRATGDKVIISVKDVNHGSLLDDFAAVFSEQNPLEVGGRRYWSAAPSIPRKAVGQDVLDPAFRGAPYTPLAWDTVGGSEVYMPIFIRNYFTKSWFDYYLKGDESGLRFTENPIEETGLLDIRSDLPDR